MSKIIIEADFLEHLLNCMCNNMHPPGSIPEGIPHEENQIVIQEAYARARRLLIISPDAPLKDEKANTCNECGHMAKFPRSDPEMPGPCALNPIHIQIEYPVRHFCGNFSMAIPPMPVTADEVLGTGNFAPDSDARPCFQVGKFYQHRGGRKMAVVGELSGHPSYPKCMIGISPEMDRLSPLNLEPHGGHFSEITKECFFEGVTDPGIRNFRWITSKPDGDNPTP